MKSISFKGMLLSALASTAFVSGSVLAVPFSVTGASFTPGGGYGIDASEASGSATLLDVRFSTTSFVAQNFNLNAIGQSFSFNMGTVDLREPNNIMGILDPAETDNLGVLATLIFTAPGAGGNKVITASGTAVAGSLSDNAADLTIDWAPLIVSYGTSGSYRIDFTDLVFTRASTDNNPDGLLNAGVTVTLLALDQPGRVPEPSSLALAGLGLLVAVGVRRRYPH